MDDPKTYLRGVVILRGMDRETAERLLNLLAEDFGSASIAGVDQGGVEAIGIIIDEVSPLTPNNAAVRLKTTLQQFLSRGGRFTIETDVDVYSLATCPSIYDTYSTEQDKKS